MALKETIGQLSHYVSECNKGIYDRRYMQAMIEKRVDLTDRFDLITVPHVTSVELIDQAQEKLGLTYLDKAFGKWDFIRDELGNVYQVGIWTPRRSVRPSLEVRSHFQHGFVGNTTAFVVWATKFRPEGWYASIPEDDKLFRGGGGLFEDDADLCAPYFYLDHELCGLGMGCATERWGDGCTFVAFRKVNK